MDHQVDASEVMCLYTPIMQSIQAKLDGILERNQVTAKDATSIYLQALESTLQQVVQLLLGADQRRLILAQTAKEDAEANLVIQQKDNTALEALNIPKQGNLIDQQILKLIGETSLIPKQAQLMDAQIIHLLRENDKLAKELALLEQQRLNLIIEGTNLGKQTELITEQIKAMKEDVAGKAMDVKVKGTQAELNRAQAYKTAAEQGALKGRALAEICSVMTGSYNTAIAHSLDLESAFDAGACSSAASDAIAAASDTVDITTFV